MSGGRASQTELSTHGTQNGSAPTLALALSEILIAEAFSRLLREAGFQVVGSYADTDALMHKVERARPELVLIEAAIEGNDGRSAALARLRHSQAPTKVVAL